MQRYERYKDSGIEWIGQIPSHWEVKRLGTCFSERRTKVSDKDYPPLSVTKKGIVPQLETAAKSNDGDNRKLVLSGDFVINSRSDRKGSSGLSKSNGSVSLINIVMEPNRINPFFSEYLFKSDAFVEEFYRNGHGIVADLWTTRFDEMKNIQIACPLIREQSAIARFLDEKCEQIDRAVAQKERVIELLNERRQIVIQRAVTRGLNPDTPLRDSGIDWIGQIPAHWEVKKLKNICYINPTKRNYSPKDRDELVQFLPMEKVTELGIYDVNNFASYSSVCNGFTYFEKGDIILAKITPCFENGKGAYLQNISTCFGFGSTEFHVLRPKKLVVGQFLYYIIKSELFRRKGEALMTGSAGQKRVQTSYVENYIISVPPLAEQEEIAAYLDTVNQKIDRAVALKREEIEKLKEYKQTLINSAVTGKIKIA